MGSVKSAGRNTYTDSNGNSNAVIYSNHHADANANGHNLTGSDGNTERTHLSAPAGGDE